MEILTRRGGAVLPEHIDLERLLAKKSKMGDGAPTVRVVVGNNYGRNADGSPKPIRAMLEEGVLVICLCSLSLISYPILSLLSTWLDSMLSPTAISLTVCLSTLTVTTVMRFIPRTALFAFLILTFGLAVSMMDIFLRIESKCEMRCWLILLLCPLMGFLLLQEKVPILIGALFCVYFGVLNLLLATLLAIYRAWARDERERLDGPPGGGNVPSDGESGSCDLSRPDVGPLLEELIGTDGVTADVVEAKLLPLYKQLSRDCEIEGRVCRGEDRVEVGG